jgi:hypothetical protein
MGSDYGFPSEEREPAVVQEEVQGQVRLRGPAYMQTQVVPPSGPLLVPAVVDVELGAGQDAHAGEEQILEGVDQCGMRMEAVGDATARVVLLEGARLDQPWGRPALGLTSARGPWAQVAEA